MNTAQRLPMINRVYVGHVLDVLKSWPDNFVDCCCSSPPYFGLRDYGLPPVVWGGDPECQHVFHTEQYVRRAADTNPGKKSASNPGSINRDAPITHATCALCGAWRGDLGAEPTPALFVEHLVAVFREVRRVLKPDGTCWLNIGDSYYGSWGNYGARKGKQRTRTEERVVRPSYEGENGYRDRPPTSLVPPHLKKQLALVPERLALALQEDGWRIRSRIVWEKINVMPESVKDRPTKADEYIFLMGKGARYHYDGEAIAEPEVKGAAGSRFDTGKTAVHQGNRASSKPRQDDGTRNARTVWQMPTGQFAGAHYATFPPELPERCIKAGCPVGGVVLDPFLGSGTAAMVAKALKREWVGIELSDEYARTAAQRISGHKRAGLAPSLPLGQDDLLFVG